MYNNFFIYFNEIFSKDLNIAIVKRPDIPAALRQYRVQEVLGRNGSLYEDLETYSDIEITIEFNFLEYDYNKFNERFRQIKNWLNNITENKLKFSDDLGFFYYVNKVVLDDPTRTYKELGQFKAIFTCEPFLYMSDGLIRRQLTDKLYNSFEISQPEYEIVGNGVLNMTINGVPISANVGGNLNINTKLGLAYKNDGTITNTALTGNYESLFLKKGNNTFTFSNGFTINIIPNWRVL